MPEEILFGLSTVNIQRQIPSIYLSGLIDKFRVVFLAAYKNLRMTQCCQKKGYDTRAPIREKKFDVGDLVYIRNSGTLVMAEQEASASMEGSTNSYGGNLSTPVSISHLQ